ncbi:MULTISPECIES: SDR family oxidoreductase [Roseomonadaceae]|uniref:SDR family oxidoreductase n=1 Tax=Falsiroseomonas oleicola TaxID=2801474 RepID=A0ABS6H3V4_9PROT|nr:SDR family oxidoreductase [Roseomonas oleicola]MBU8543354.1 SDR family oxidoreductase [Roseomonas oleicola]
MELKNKTIIITGASSGIGKAAALLFAAEGANVVLGARRAELLRQLAGDIERTGGRAAVLAGDVREEGFAEALVDAARSEFGGLHGAFNNAGIVGPMSAVADMELTTWQEIIDVNLTSAFRAAKAQIPAFGQGAGSIVFTSSFVGFSNGGMPGMAAYAASKAGLIGLVRSLASDHAAAGIRVNALLPGGTVTPAGGEGNAAVLDLIATLHPMRRMATAHEIAQAALFLLSDRSSFMTGSPMLVDGGISVRLM